MTDDSSTPRYQVGDIIGETTEEGGRLDLVLAVGHESYFVRHLGGLGAFEDLPNAEPLEAAWGIEGCEALTYLHERPARRPATEQPCPTCDGTGGDHQIGCQP